ncbi:MAG: TonB-dependent receptor [Gammaproteobacteria bacterium]
MLPTITILSFAAVDSFAQGALEEIIVTARKREENIQNVGISMSAVGRQEIERRFITDIRDLVDISPNLIIDDTAQGPGGVAAAYIRGIGVADVESNFDPAVATVIDGIYHGKLSGGILKTFDVESVEVLRGPQGTLFGRNAIGGVMKLERTKPTGELGGKLRIGYGAYDSYNIDGIINAGNEDLAVKLSGARRVQDKGYFENVNTGRDDGRSEYTALGFNALFRPTDSIEIEASFDIERTTQDTPPLLYVGQPAQAFCNPALRFKQCPPSVDVPLSGDRYKTLQQGPFEGEVYGQPSQFFPQPVVEESYTDATFDTNTAIVELRWDLTSDYHLDYIYGHRETDETVVTDWDATPEVWFHTTRPEQYEQDSHELRLTYSGGGPLSFVAGGYYWESEYDIQLISYIGFLDVLGFGAPNDVAGFPRDSRQETENWALFFEADYDLLDQWTLTLGGRYSVDDKSSEHAGAPTLARVSEDWNEFTPKVGLRYQMRDDLMMYAGWTKGYRSGGFVGRPDVPEIARVPYDPETVDNYEIGFKSEWWDNRLRLNASFFYMDYNDKQEEASVTVVPDMGSASTGQQTIIANAATATIYGIEVDVVAYLTDALYVRGNFGWLDAGYDDFFADLDGRLDGPLEDPNMPFDAMTNPRTPIVEDNSDLKFRRAPTVTFSLSGVYEWEAMGGTAWIRGGYHYIGETEVTLQNSPQTHNDAQHLLDASINFLYRNTQVSLYGRNLAEADGYGIGFDVGSTTGLWTYAAPRAPRTWGLEVSYTF